MPDLLSSIITVQCWGVQRRVLTAEEWSLPQFRQRVDAVNFMLAGTSVLRLDGAEYHLEPGQAVFMPEGTEISRGLASSAVTVNENVNRIHRGICLLRS